MTERISPISPLYGQRIVDRDDLSPRGFTDAELHSTYAALVDARHNYDMAMESPTFEEVDEYFNPGVDDIPSDFVLEAIVVDKFSKTERRMAAVVRVLNRHI